MPVTRGKARMMESQEEDMEEEPSQQMPETQEEPTAMEAVDLKEMAKQLTKTLKHLLTTHRELENDAAMIQAGMDELYGMQEERAKTMSGRLKNASSTILTFGEASQDGQHGGPEREADDNDIEDDRMN